MDKILKKLPIAATAALLVAGAFLFAGCEKEKVKHNDVDKVLNKSENQLVGTWVCDTNNYRVELCFSNNGNSFFSRVNNHSHSGLMFDDSTWNDYVWQSDSVIQIVRKITANDTFSVPNNVFKITRISDDRISFQFDGYSTSPTWMVRIYQFKYIK